MIWKSIAEDQARIIEQLINLCHRLIDLLSQHTSVEEEEELLRELEGHTDG